jgi:hypothetical protein
MTNTTHTLRLIDEYLTQGGYTPGIDDITLNHEAHLVAAAPDLLAALEAFELWTDALANAGEMTLDAWIELDKLHQKACSAIDKAKGN